MSSFSSLKKSSKDSIEKLIKSAEALDNTTKDDSNEYWKPTVDKSGNSFSVIRFLPVSPQDSENEETAEIAPWVKYYDHGFQCPATGLWYIEKSLTSIGKQDAISEYNSQLWNTGIEANREIVKKQKRRLHYVSNIYVVKDNANPENNGKVFKYVYGKKIHEKIIGAMKPQFEDEVAINPFHLWEGANFKLKIRKVEGYQNYDLSEWEAPSPLLDDDEALEKVWRSQYSLQEIIDPKNFKSEEELEARLKKVLGVDQQKPKFKTAEESSKSRLDDVPTEKPKSPSKPTIADDDEDDSDLSYFESLVGDE